MSDTIIVHKGRTNILTLKLGIDTSADVIRSEIRTMEGDKPLIAEWDVQPESDGSDGIYILTLDDVITAQIKVKQASMMIPLNGLIGSAQAGKFIQGINNVTLSATTGTAGAFGVTATRYRAAMYKPIANARFTQNALDLGLPEIPNSSCLMAIQLASTTTTGVVRAIGKIVHG